MDLKLNLFFDCVCLIYDSRRLRRHPHHGPPQRRRRRCHRRRLLIRLASMIEIECPLSWAM